eukprot:3375658-Alexandrium_andersonii.AAC.1
MRAAGAPAKQVRNTSKLPAISAMPTCWLHFLTVVANARPVQMASCGAACPIRTMAWRSPGG